jgi:hypothetical protein
MLTGDTMGLDSARFHQLARIMGETSRALRAAETPAEVLRGIAGRADLKQTPLPNDVVLQVLLVQHDVLNKTIDTLHEVIEYLEVEAERR